MAAEEARLLLSVNEDSALERMIGALASREGFRLIPATNAADAVETLELADAVRIEAIVLDQAALDGDGLAEIRAIKQAAPSIPMVVLTASMAPQDAVEAMRAGAKDYLVKPVSADGLLEAIRKATAPNAAQYQLHSMSEKTAGALDFDGMVGAAAPFRTALAKAATAARGHGHVMVEGESGTGKDMLLGAIHAASPRAKGPIHQVKIGSVPSGSIESLLFGHEQGAFPGAFERRAGLLPQCDGGTLVLDEVDKLDDNLQHRLAEMLENGIVRPAGAQHGFRTDIRVLAASDVPLDTLVDEARFLPELRDRLSASRVTLPALRDRAEDIPALSRHFLSRIGEQPGLKHHSVADSALALLEAYDWPGNVRQLHAVLFRAAVFCDGEALTADSFPQLLEMLGDQGDRLESRQRGIGIMLYTDDGNLRELEDIEADIIRLAIGHYRGKMTEVARRLGIGRSTLYRKLSDLGIDNAA